MHWWVWLIVVGLILSPLVLGACAGFAIDAWLHLRHPEDDW